LAQPGHRGGHEEGVVGGPEWLGVQVDCAEKGGQLGLVQEADIRTWLHDRRVNERAEGRRLQALRLEMPQKALTGLGDRYVGVGVLRLLGIDQLPQRLLGFATGQPFFAVANAYRSDLAIGAAGAVCQRPYHHSRPWASVRR
jgi:hypothetical protein